MTHSHTPGPWAVNQPSHLTTHVESEYRIVAEIHPSQCYDEFSDYDRATPLDDARLIAAAPDMLEALEYSLQMLHASYLDHEQSSPDNASAIHGAIEMTKTAINKAKGI